MILASQHLRHVIFARYPMVVAETLKEEQIQPASIDCRLGETFYCLKAGGLPKPNETIEEFLKGNYRSKERMRNDVSYVLHQKQCYLVPLQERLILPDTHYATFSQKSSVGRVDVFARVVGDGTRHYDRVLCGYHGPLFLEITPLSFSVRATSSLSLVQMRLHENYENSVLSTGELMDIHARYGLVYSRKGDVLAHREIIAEENCIYLHIDLSREIVGFEALDQPFEDVHLHKTGVHDPADFWRPIWRPRSDFIILAPGKFYLLATKERVRIPPSCCAEIKAYDVGTGEFRSHYAGFFDNGFGGERGTTVVLEVRARDVPLRLYDGQVICKMAFEKTRDIPDKLYGSGIGSTYTGSGPSLSKYFKNREAVWK